MQTLEDFEKDSQKEIDELVMLGEHELRLRIQKWFGTVSFNHMGPLEKEELDGFVSEFASSIQRSVARHAIRQMTKHQEVHSMNVFRAVLAGSAAMERDITGKEPEGWVLRVVKNQEEPDPEGGEKKVADPK